MYRKYYSYNDMPIAAKPNHSADSSKRVDEKCNDEKIIPAEEHEECEPTLAAVCEKNTPVSRSGKFLGRFENDDILLLVVIFILLMDDCDDDLLLAALAVIFFLGK